MVGENVVQRLTLPAGADLSDSQWLVGTLDTSAQVIVSTTAAAGGVGIIDEPVAAEGRASSVITLGVARAYYGGTVTAGEKLTNNASGQLVAISATTDGVVGIALEAGSSGEVHSVLLK